MLRLVQYSDLENVYDEPERAARLAGTVRALDGPDALVVGTGDNTSPGVLALVERGRQSLDFFCAVDADYDTFGNHDFDYGSTATRELVADSPQTWLSANVFEGDARFGEEVGVLPWTVRDVDGVRVGLFGVTEPATRSLNPMAADLTFSDPYAAAEEAAAKIGEAGADAVVALSHLGSGDDELARRVDADVILGGHVHAERIERIDGTLLTRPGANGHAVLEIVLDADGPRAIRHDATEGEPVESVARALRGRVEAAGLDEPVARVEGSLPRDEAVVFGGECAIGNFVADAYRWATGADVGLQNSGGIRAGPPLSGDVTRADLISVIPFEERVVLTEVTGTELRQLFRECAGRVVGFGEPHWWHGHVSGAEIVWNDDVDDLRCARVGDRPIDPTATYRVATPDYLLHTDHEFPTLDERHRVGEVGIQHDVLAEYARERGISPNVEGRIRRGSGSAECADDSTLENDSARAGGKAARAREAIGRTRKEIDRTRGETADDE